MDTKYTFRPSGRFTAVVIIVIIFTNSIEVESVLIVFALYVFKENFVFSVSFY